MAVNNPSPRGRKRSIGTLQVLDTRTLNHPSWHSSPTPEPSVSQLPVIEPQIDPIADTKGTNGISTTSPRYESTLSPREVNDEDPTNNNEHTKNGSERTNIENGSAVQFRPQVSQISDFSQVTLGMSFKEKYFSWRYMIASLLHLFFICSILMRNCMPIALVCMADPMPQVENWDTHLNTSHNGILHSSNEISRNGTQQEYEFYWDLRTQSLILSGVQFSSCVGPLILDIIRNRFGSKHTITVSTLLGAALTFLTPFGARLSPWALFTIRILLGIALGANVSTSADILSWWSPATEKQTMMSFAFAGVNIGGIITSLAAGFLCSIPVDNGWPFIFYVFGLLILLCQLAMHFLIANKPEEHPYISEIECNQIMNYRSPIVSGPKGKPEIPPYKKILTSVPVVSFLITASCQVWSTNLYFTYLPNFFVTVNKFTVGETGVLMSLVSAARFLGIPLWTTIINRLRQRRVPNTKVKKIIIAAGYGTAGVCQAIIMFLDARYRWVAFGLFMVLLASQSAGMCVVTVMPLDMAPRYAGFLSGLFYSLGSLVSITGPLMVAALTPKGTPEEWRIVWIIVICVFVSAIVIFVTFCDATVQPWARVHRDSRPNIQSPFMAMGRRMSAVLDGPMTTNKITSGINPLANQMDGVSMSPRGSDLSVVGTETIENNPPTEGVVNFAFQPDGPSPDMIDSVSNPGNPDDMQEQEVDDFRDLKYIDDFEEPENSEGDRSQGDNITRL